MTTTATPDQKGACPLLITALCERDVYTRDHCDRVSALALEVGYALTLPAADLESSG